jgi:hypothetical protein
MKKLPDISPEDIRIDDLIQQIQDAHTNLMASFRRDAEKGAFKRATDNNIRLWFLVEAELKRGGKKLKAMMNVRAVQSETEKIARLRDAFVFACKLAKLADDLVTDDKDVQPNRDKPYLVAEELIKLGRLKDLDIFLDHPDTVLQAYAGVCVAKIYPERAEAVLKKIDEGEKGRPLTVAGITAMAGLIPLEYNRRKKEEALQNQTGKDE